MTFEIKFIFFQINGICSRRILLPGFGALGRIRVAGLIFSSLKQDITATAVVHSSPIPDENRNVPQGTTSFVAGRVYMIEYVSTMIYGSVNIPSRKPIRLPVIDADAEYTKYKENPLDYLRKYSPDPKYRKLTDKDIKKATKEANNLEKELEKADWSKRRDIINNLLKDETIHYHFYPQSSQSR